MTKRKAESRAEYNLRIRQKQHAEGYYHKNKARLTHNALTWKQAHPESKELCAQYYQLNKDRWRSISLKKNYGLTLSDYDKMLSDQQGRCAICETTSPGGLGRFNVDHCHKTHKIRGLLCQRCNLAIGQFEDSCDLLVNAIKYLSK